MIDCTSFKRYNGDSSDELLPLDNPGQVTGRLDVLRSIPGFEDSDSDSEDFMPPALRFMKHLASRANRRANSGKKSQGWSRLWPRSYNRHKTDAKGQLAHFPRNTTHSATRC